MIRSMVVRLRGAVAVCICIGACASLVNAMQVASPGLQRTVPRRGTAAISGLVVDRTTDRPVAGAAVTVVGGSAETTTDPIGRFVLQNLPPSPPGGYLLRATRPGYLQVGSTSVRGRGGLSVAVTDGQWLRDVRIEVERLASLSGRVVNEVGEPVVGAVVRVLARVPIAGHSRLAVGPAARTDDRGEYSISGLKPGEYLVSLPSVQSTVPDDVLGADRGEDSGARSGARSGRSSTLGRDTSVIRYPEAGVVVGSYVGGPPPDERGARIYPPLFYPQATAPLDASAIEVGLGDDRTGIDFRLAPEPGWRVSGHIEGGSGRVEGLVLRLLQSAATDLGVGGETATARVSRDGRFVFIGVPAGSYRILVRPSSLEYRYDPGGGAGSVRPPPIVGTRSTGVAGGVVAAAPTGTSFSVTPYDAPEVWGALDVSVRDGNVDGLRLSLQPTMSISGRIAFDPTGDTRPSAPRRVRVTAEPANGDPANGAPSAWANAEPGSSALAFTLGGLVSGDYVLRVSAGGTIQRMEIGGQDITHRPIEMRTSDIDGLSITLTAESGRLSGTVQGLERQPEGATVIAFPVERSQWTNYGWQPPNLKGILADEAGRFEFRLPAGRYLVVAIAGDRPEMRFDASFLERAAPVASETAVEWGQSSTLHLVVRDIR